MEKSILHPGNGINFPNKGDYIKMNFEVKDDKGNVILNSEHTKKKFLEIRYKCTESNLFDGFEDLIGEMSLFEKCSLEVDNTKIGQINSKEIDNLLTKHNKIIFIIEIINISKTTHF